MRIVAIEAQPVRLPRDLISATGTAGTPTTLESGGSSYRWSSAYPCLYSTDFETALVRVRLSDGRTGIGEAQAPVAPEVACTIVDRILSAAITGEEFDPTPDGIERLYWQMYAAMRVRGQTGGFMLDAIAGVDLALWDLAGQIQDVPVGELLGEPGSTVPAYLSGLPGGSVEGARRWVDQGFERIKIFYDRSTTELEDLIRQAEAVVPRDHIAVDALWHLDESWTPEGLWFLECPYYPELVSKHERLRQRTNVPIALGESYRSTFELAPFLARKLMDIVQPDLGRTGITGALSIGREARLRGMQVIPHVSVAMGPQIAAAIHFASGTGCPWLEFNPAVASVANQYLRSPIRVEGGYYHVPEGPGLGVELTT